MDRLVYTVRMNVLLLAGGNFEEREVSLLSGRSVEESLKALGHQYDVKDPSDDGFDIDRLALRYDVVFIAIHGRGGEDGLLQRHLEDLDKPFVGSGSKASKLCFDKWEYKEFLKQKGLPAVEGRLVSVNDMYIDDFMKPYVLKPINSGSGFDLQVVRRPSERDRGEVAEMLSRRGKMLLEPLIEGAEITVGVLGDEVLPVAEVIPPEGKSFTRENQYNGLSQILCPPANIPEGLQKQAKELAKQIHDLTGCRHMSRTDFIIDRNGKLLVLETNTIPGLTNQSLLPKMAAAAGYSMSEMVSKLLKMAVTK